MLTQCHSSTFYFFNRKLRFTRSIYRVNNSADNFYRLLSAAKYRLDVFRIYDY